ncbi:MAG TPA: hypothetical protein PKL08_18070, partial [Thermoanaerobaculaceae bacterium]|nr:hypothetical protein [Thermoanaerobaculaceae bacterium]
TSIVEVRYSGALTEGKLADALDGARQLACRYGITKVLADCSGLTVAPRYGTLAAIANAFTGDYRQRQLRRALLLPKSHLLTDRLEFWETLCCNRGTTARLFSERAAALAWLSESDQPSCS